MCEQEMIRNFQIHWLILKKSKKKCNKFRVLTSFYASHRIRMVTWMIMISHSSHAIGCWPAYIQRWGLRKILKLAMPSLARTPWLVCPSHFLLSNRGSTSRRPHDLWISFLNPQQVRELYLTPEILRETIFCNDQCYGPAFFRDTIEY